MSSACKWHVGAAMTVLVLCRGASAQIYSPPNVNNIQQRFTAPTIATRMDLLRFGQLNAGYGGGNSPYNAYLSQSSAPSSRPRASVGTGLPTRASKPFSSYSSSSPAVSPYLNLFRTDLGTGGNFNYNTLVQPQLQQQQINQQLERQALQANRRLQAIAAQADFNAQGSKDQYPTGHQTVFNYMGRYYQQPQIRQKRR